MPRRSVKAQALPPSVQQGLRSCGRNLRSARLRRRMTQAEVAERLGVDRRSIAAMEAGAPQAPLGLVAGALWIFGLGEGLAAIAAPDADAVGRALEERRLPRTARKAKADDDF